MRRFLAALACGLIASNGGIHAQQPPSRVQDGRYQRAGTTLQVPTSWTYRGTVEMDVAGEATAHWMDPQSGISLYVWMGLDRRETAL